MEGRGDEAAHSDYGGVPFDGFVKYPFLLDHHSEVHHFESVASKDYSCYVLSDVVHIPFDRCVDYHRFVGNVGFGGGLFFLHVRLQDGYGVTHYLGGLHDLGEEHLSVPEKLPDLFHSGHEGSFDDLDGFAVFGKTLKNVSFKGLR